MKDERSMQADEQRNSREVAGGLEQILNTICHNKLEKPRILSQYGQIFATPIPISVSVFVFSTVLPQYGHLAILTVGRGEINAYR